MNILKNPLGSALNIRRGFKRLSHRLGLNRLAARLQEKRRRHLREKGIYHQTFTLRPGITFRIDKASRSPFQMFTYKDPSMIREMDLFLCMAREHACFLDLGSLYGIFSMAFCRLNPEALAYAVEPSPKAQKVLRLNIDLNPEMKISTKEFAFGKEEGALNMHYEWVHAIADHQKNHARSVAIPMTTLDHFVESENISPTLIKLDVDGYEGPILTGGQHFLSKHDPVLFLELHGHWIERYGYHPLSILEILRNYGYQFYDQELKKVEDEKTAFSIFANRLICVKDPKEILKIRNT